jgi:hypothetical protein
MASSVEMPCCPAACSIISLTSGVSMKAGLTVLTRMPSAAYCLERALEWLSRALLDAPHSLAPARYQRYLAFECQLHVRLLPITVSFDALAIVAPEPLLETP